VIALLRRLPASPIAIIGIAIVAFWVIVALLAPLLAPLAPTRSLQPMALPGDRGPGGIMFWLGTDVLGRDILSRIIFGTRSVLLYAPLATLTAFAAGIAMGLVAGFKGGWLDEALSRFADLILAFPLLILYIVIIAKFGASAVNIVLAVTLGAMPGIMRITRGLVLDQRGRAYVQAAQLRGEPVWYILIVEILPNVRGPLIVDFCLRLGYVIIAIGTLGFLGLGLPPPNPDWGTMINENRNMALVFPHMVVFPCIAVSSLVLGFNLLADGIRELSQTE